MEEIMDHLRESIADEILSKPERKSLRDLVTGRRLKPEQLSVLRSRIYELANEKATAANYPFIIEWIRNVNSALSASVDDPSDAYFSPGEFCRNAIIKEIKDAVSDVKICVFTISDDRITQAIVDTHRKAKMIKVITDNEKCFDRGSDISRLCDVGIAIRTDDTPNHMHHKFMIIDNRTLITGSYNWTQSAARFNHENILITREAKVVNSFLKEFDLLWGKMLDYKK